MDLTPPGLPPLVRPFAAERYSGRRGLRRLIAPPYDVVSPARRAQLAAADARNIVHLTLPAPPEPYRQAADTLRAWREAGILVRDLEPTVTIVRQDFVAPTGSAGSRTGFIAAVRAEAYATRRVRPHERTRAGPKADRLQLLEATATVLEPILLLARDVDGAIAGFLDAESEGAPDATADLDGVRHTLWIAPGERAEPVLTSLRDGPLYVADGHHRYETAAAYAGRHARADWVTALIVPATDPGVAVLPTHRLLRGGVVNRERFHGAIAGLLEPATGNAADCTIIWPDGREERLALRGDSTREVRTARLDSQVVAPLLEAAEGGAVLEYTPDEAEARAGARAGELSAAVLLPPTPVIEVFAVADAGGFMPPKSTYFYPKVPAGLVLGPLQ